jgi:hypothetical protein
MSKKFHNFGEIGEPVALSGSQTDPSTGSPVPAEGVAQFATDYAGQGLGTRGTTGDYPLCQMVWQTLS